MAEEKDDTYERVSGMAKAMGLKGSERTEYIHEHMTRLGYDAKPNYVKKKGRDENNRSGGGFFGGNNRRQRDDDDDDDDL